MTSSMVEPSAAVRRLRPLRGEGDVGEDEIAADAEGSVGPAVVLNIDVDRAL